VIHLHQAIVIKTGQGIIDYNIVCATMSPIDILLQQAKKRDLLGAAKLNIIRSIRAEPLEQKQVAIEELCKSERREDHREEL